MVGYMAKQAKKIRIYSALEVANICGVVNQTAINWIKNGHLKAFTTPGGQYRIYAEDLVDFLEGRGMRIPSEVVEVANREKKQILIVEDEIDLNDMLRILIEQKFAEFEVQQAYDGFEAGQMIANGNPAVILLDINLPGIDGHKLIERIRSDESLSGPRIIAMSGIQDEITSKDRILAEGADVFMEKPIDTDSLVSVIQDLVDQGMVRG